MTVQLKNFNPSTYDYFDDFQFKEKLRESLKCPACKQLLKDPLQLGCGDRICRSCCEDLPIVGEENKKLCPTCEQLIEEEISDRSALLDIIKLQVFCTMRQKGCTWEGSIFFFLPHLEVCTWQCFTCDMVSLGCDFSGNKSELEDHYKENISSHFYFIAKSEQGTWTSNFLSEQTQIEISSTCGRISAQLDLDFDTLTEMKKVINVSMARTDKVKEGLDVEKKLYSERRDGLSQLMPWSQKNDTQKKKAALMKLIQRVTPKVEQFEMKSKEISVQNASLDKPNMERKLKELDKERKHARSNLAETDLKVRLFQATTTDGKYIWKIDNFHRRMKEARDGKVSELYSPPLFTHTFGYKTCCKLFLNGNEQEEIGFGTHVAFYCVVMKGKYDDILRFPFPTKFIITLLNRNGDHVRKVISPSRNDASVQKPTKEMNPIVGFSTFISHSEIEDCFIWDGALFFKLDFVSEYV